MCVAKEDTAIDLRSIEKLEDNFVSSEARTLNKLTKHQSDQIGHVETEV